MNQVLGGHTSIPQIQFDKPVTGSMTINNDYKNVGFGGSIAQREP